MNERVEERAEESAEQVLARLERYAASLRARPPELAPADRRPPPVDTLIPSRTPSRVPSLEGMPSRPHRFASEVAPALIAVTICSFVILLSQWFGAGVAAVAAGALLLVGVVGLVRRVPLARAYTFGLVIAALLIRLS